jgi:hypothetical protein
MPESWEPYVFGIVRERITKNQVEKFNFIRNWPKHYKEPDEVDIFEFEVAISLMRATTKFYAVHHETTALMETFKDWAVNKGLAGSTAD